MAARRTSAAAAEAEAPDLTGLDDDQLVALAADREIELPAGADRETVISTLAAAIAEQNAAAAKDDADADGEKPPADTPPAPEPAAKPKRRAKGNGHVAVDSLFYNGAIIPAGDELPDDFPEDRLQVLLDRGQVE